MRRIADLIGVHWLTDQRVDDDTGWAHAGVLRSATTAKHCVGIVGDRSRPMQQSDVNDDVHFPVAVSGHSVLWW